MTNKIKTSLHGKRIGLDFNDDLIINSQRAALNPTKRIVTLTASTLTITRDLHDLKTIVVDRAAGSTITLPAATGSGARYRFFVLTTITSNSLTIKVANASDTIEGHAIQGADSGSTVNLWEAGGTSDTITLNGTTTGGIKGDMIEIEDIATNIFYVKIVGSATGIEATPFSATVS
jgi:hypothetical protein